MSTNKKHYCYILKNADGQNKTYIGYTTNPQKRIKQHNGIISGGAKATRGKQWKIFCLFEFDNEHNAMSFEWNLKHPCGNKKSSKFCGIDGKINSINELIRNNKICDNTICYIESEFIDKINKCNNIIINLLNEKV